MMRMRNLGSVCAKLGRSGTMMMNTERRRRCDSTGGDFEGGLRGALGTGWRTLARCSYFFCFFLSTVGEYLRPYDHQYLYECIEEADSDVQTYLERINIAERSLDAVLNLEDKCFGPKH
ncbi:unnamed protein product [Brassica rapa]|uniref:Uncharacterized protein n=1 Tax=Brassica campestris TaxID=3711 RepID=A0A3P6AF32_BRACM|nr:unnamed protein product [Brassica rapa]VDC82821.1 unnamed protein product [Brassica rapa]